jgi:hypothetical protein
MLDFAKGRRSDRADAVAMTAEEINLTALRGDKALYSAYVAALWLRARIYEPACQIIDSYRKKRPDFLELVADALKDAARFEATPTRHRLIVTHAAAWMAKAKREGKGGPILDLLKNTPTLQEWKESFRPNERLPSDLTFRRASRELGCLPYRKAGGRPRGSKDQIKRKRRKNWALKFRTKNVFRG